MNKNPRHQSADMYSTPCPEAGDRAPSSESRRDGGFSEVSAFSRTFQNNSFAPESFFIAFKMNKSANCSPLSLPTPVTALIPRDHTALRLPIAAASPLSTITTSPYDTSSAPLNSTIVHPAHLDQFDEDLEDFHLEAMSSTAWVDSLITTIGNVAPETRPSCMYGEHLLAGLCRNGTPLAEVESQDNLTASSNSGSPPPFLRIESDIDNGYDSESMIRPQVQASEEATLRPGVDAGIDELDLIEIEGRITSANREDLDWMRYLGKGVDDSATGITGQESVTKRRLGGAAGNIMSCIEKVGGETTDNSGRDENGGAIFTAFMFVGVSQLAKVSRVQKHKLRRGKWRNHAGQNPYQARLQVPPTVNWTLPHSLPEGDGNVDSLVYPDDQSCGGILNWVQGLFACFTSREVPSMETHSSTVTVTTPLCSIPSMTYGSTSTVDSLSLFRGLFEDESDGEDFGRNASVRHRRTELQWSDEDSSDNSESD
ncbi:hypothetical protein HDU80_011120, partial [Chytriomyces hyalinus]